jgi:hypothetical protein
MSAESRVDLDLEGIKSTNPIAVGDVVQFELRNQEQHRNRGHSAY